MIRRAKIKLAEWLLQIIRAYFIGKTLAFFKLLDGQPVYRGEGKVIGGVITRDLNRMPTGMNLMVSQPGHSPTDLKRCSILTVKRHKQLGWVSDD